MRRVSGGYTIIEVIIFLTITVILFTSAIKLIDGRQAEVTFQQTTQDASSQIQSWINSVPTGFSGANPGQINCTISAGQPLIKAGAPSVTPQCIFLGKAIQFTGTDTSPGSGNVNQLFAYSIFGCRLVNCNLSGALPTNLTAAVPVVAVSNGADLTQQFNLGAVKVIDVTSSAVNSNYTKSHLVGFFNSSNTELSSGTNGALDLDVYQFRFDGSSPTPGNQTGGSVLLSCLQLTSNACKAIGSPDQWPEPLLSLQVCLSDGNRTALLTIKSSYGIGATTKLQYTSCS